MPHVRPSYFDNGCRQCNQCRYCTMIWTIGERHELRASITPCCELEAKIPEDCRAALAESTSASSTYNYLLREVAHASQDYFRENYKANGYKAAGTAMKTLALESSFGHRRRGIGGRMRKVKVYPVIITQKVIHVPMRWTIGGGYDRNATHEL